MRSARVRPLACVALLAFAIGAVVQTTGVLDELERDTISTRFDQRGASRPNDIVVVAVDAKTFDRLRVQWPFPRSLHG
jgi:CHASE2 domain-containing sensor protein